MTLANTHDLVGFYRPRWIGSGFAVPLFGARESPLVQQAQSGRIAEFLRCDVPADSILGPEQVVVTPATRSAVARISARRIGDAPIYAFYWIDKRVQIGSSGALLAAIEREIACLKLEANPFLALDVEEFRAIARDERAQNRVAAQIYGSAIASSKAAIAAKSKDPKQEIEATGTDGRPQSRAAVRTYRRVIASSKVAVAAKSKDPKQGTRGNISAPTKSDILAAISKDTGLSRRQVSSVFSSLDFVIKKSLRSYGQFTLPGLAKMKVVKRPSSKSREGVNPFTGEKMVFKAKPASKKVRVLPLKNLKSVIR